MVTELQDAGRYPPPAVLLRRQVFAFTIAGAALAACGGDDEASPATTADTAADTTAAAAGSTSDTSGTSSGVPTYVVELTGGAEVPGPGDPEGTGTLELQFSAAGEVCINGELDGIDEITALHLHSGTADEASEEADVTIDLGSQPGDDDPLAPFPLNYCVTADPAAIEDLISELAEDPGDYLVNVHTAEYPDGAARGQLSTAS